MLKYLNNKLIIVENNVIGKKEIIEKLVSLIDENRRTDQITYFSYI